jgi:hypothetical protein
VGDADARTLEKGFASFEARDLQNLDNGAAICRIERSDNDFNLTIPLPGDPEANVASEIRNQVVTASRAKYATPRGEVEAELFGTVEEQFHRQEAKRPRSDAAANVTPTKSPAFVPTPVTPVTSPSGPSKTVSPADELDGAHEVLKQKIRAAAENLGFIVEPEWKLPSGKRIDLVLERRGIRIACETSRTTTVDWELGNVKKCFEESFQHIAVISLTTPRLIKIRDQVLSQLEPEQAKSVQFFQPDEFITWLQRFRDASTSKSAAKKEKKRTFAFGSFTEEERRRLEEEKRAVIEEFMRRRAKQ